MLAISVHLPPRRCRPTPAVTSRSASNVERPVRCTALTGTRKNSTPPVGLNLYVASGITGVPVYTVLGYVLPWMLAVVACLLVVTYFPPLSLVLPDLLWAR